MEAEPKPPDEPSEVEAERARRIADLEARLSKRGAVGVSPWVAALGAGLTGTLLWTQRLELQYLVSPREPISLGVEGSYRLDLLESNRFAQIHGLPTLRGTYGFEAGKAIVMVGIQQTPIALVRPALPTEEWKPGSKPPMPDQRPFSVRGRLLKREDAELYERDGFKQLETVGEVNPRWVMIEGAKPGSDFKQWAWSSVLSALAFFNLWLLVRSLRARLQR